MSTLKLDVQITEDGHAVVTHDRDLSMAENGLRLPRPCRPRGR